MPLRFLHPYIDVTKKIKHPSNPYVAKFLNGTLPIQYGEKLKSSMGEWRAEIDKFHVNSHASSEIINKETSQRPLWIEIGCHTGEILITLAERYPKHNVVGIDITFKRIVRSAEKILKKKLKNAMCLFADARYIDELFAKEEVTGVVIFFPDPWLKKKRSKNRLVNREFCQKLFCILQPGGFVWFKTDQKIYFDGVLECMDELGFERQEAVEHTDFISEKRKYFSAFQRQFMHKDIPTFEAFLRKQSI